MAATGARSEEAAEASAAEQARAPARKAGGTHSGRLLLRMPEALHARLADASEKEGLSLNAYINRALTDAVGGRGGSAAPRPAREAPARRRSLDRLLLVNVVVV